MTLTLQTGSRYLHINVEVRPSPTKLQPLEKRDNTFSLDVLPDGSRMVTVRLAYQSPGYERNKPQLNQLYVDTVHLLQLHTNFNELPHTTDYLRALAHCLEAGYFGLSRVDNDALTLMRSLARQLQYLHRYPSEPQRPDIHSSKTHPPPTPSPAAGSAGDFERPYAAADDFAESSPQGARSFTSTLAGGKTRDDRGDAGGQYVNDGSVPPGEGTVDSVGRMHVEGKVRDAAKQPTGHQRNTVSVRVSADTDGEDIVVKTSIEDDSVSQSKTFGVQDGQSQDSGSAKSQSHASGVGSGPSSSISSDSQLGSSGSSVSQSDSSSLPLSQSDTSESSERGPSRTDSSRPERKVEGVQGDNRDQQGGSRATLSGTEPTHSASGNKLRPQGVDELVEGSDRGAKDPLATANNDDDGAATSISRGSERRPDDEL